MKAAVLTAFNASPEIMDVTVGDLLPQEVRIRTAATGVCGSDRHGQTGGIPSLGLPTVLGHEASGIVLEVGAQVQHVAPGDHVVVAPAASCGLCSWCSTGQPQHCTDQMRDRPVGTGSRLHLAGAPLGQFVGVGSFAEEMLVQSSAVARVPREMPLDKAALLGCAVITGLGAIRRSAQVQFGETVAVLGCGGVGLSAVQGAVLSGASRIIAIDRMPEKLALATSFGATDVVDASSDDPTEQVLELTKGGVDHVIEVVGRPSTIEQAFAMLRTRGTATVVGLPHVGDSINLPATALLAEKRLQGSRLGGTHLRTDAPLYAEMYLSGRLDLDPLQGHTISLKAVGEALGSLDASAAARTVITF